MFLRTGVQMFIYKSNPNFNILNNKNNEDITIDSNAHHRGINIDNNISKYSSLCMLKSIESTRLSGIKWMPMDSLK